MTVPLAQQHLPAPVTRIRVLPIPQTAPPAMATPSFDPPPPSRFIQGTLAVDFDAEHSSGYFGPQPSRSAQLPEAREWSAHMAQALVEVMTAARPAPQVVRWTSPEVYAALVRRAAASSRRQAGGGRRAVVRTVRVCEPADGVVEACAVVVDSGRVRALAMRMVGIDHRWVVTELQVG
jgi:hypothetical protein